MSRRKRVVQILQDINMTQRQLAQYAMLSIKSLNSWIDNKIAIPYKSVLLIADFLGVDPNDLLEVV